MFVSSWTAKRSPRCWHEGRSIESIARETGRAASTVAYWVNKHGLTLDACAASRRARRD